MIFAFEMILVWFVCISGIDTVVVSHCLGQPWFIGTYGPCQDIKGEDRNALRFLVIHTRQQDTFRLN